MKSNKDIVKELLEYTKETKIVVVVESLITNDFEELNEEETIKVIGELESTLNNFTNGYLLIKYKYFINSFISGEIDELTISKKGVRDVILFNNERKLVVRELESYLEKHSNRILCHSMNSENEFIECDLNDFQQVLKDEMNKKLLSNIKAFISQEIESLRVSDKENKSKLVCYQSYDSFNFLN